MSLTLNTYPSKISNAAAFNVTTSLVEDSSHVNLRVRADIYHEGIVKATIEKPKGLADFDFANILKALVPGFSMARDSGLYLKTADVGSNLVTSLASASGSWDALTAVTNHLVTATEASASAVWMKTNDITVAIGEVYEIYLTTDGASYDSGVNRPYVKLSSGGPAIQVLSNIALANAQNSDPVILIPSSSGTIHIEIGNDSGQLDFGSCYVVVKKITSLTALPTAPYFVEFTEVYENSSGVTATGGTLRTAVYSYIPASGDSIAFSNYVLSGTSSKFACKTFNNGIAKFWTGYEYWIMLFTERGSLSIAYKKNGGATNYTPVIDVHCGFAVVVLNIGELLASVTSNLQIWAQLVDALVTHISETVTIVPETTNITERVILEYDGVVGGKEYLAFEGITDKSFKTEREYYLTSNRAQKPLLFLGRNNQTLETLFKDMANAEYLKSLLLSTNVKRLEDSYATPKDVTVISDSVKINKGTELFTNQISIEYED